LPKFFRSLGTAWQRMTCDHEWQLVVNVVLKSGFQQLMEAAEAEGKNKKDALIEMEAVALPLEMFRQTHIHIQRCKHCKYNIQSVIEGPR